VKLVSGATTVTTTSATSTTAGAVIATRITTTSVNLRKWHSIYSARIAVLPAGRTLKVYRTWKDASGRLWLNVSTGGMIGWVAARYTRPA